MQEYENTKHPKKLHFLLLCLMQTDLRREVAIFLHIQPPGHPVFPTFPELPQIPHRAVVHSFKVAMTKKLTPQERKSRRPASRACRFCLTKHLQCSNTRPCQNCIKRNIADSCHNVERKKAKYLIADSPLVEDDGSISMDALEAPSMSPQIMKPSVVSIDSPRAMKPLGVPSKSPHLLETLAAANSPHYDSSVMELVASLGKHKDLQNSTPSTNANFNSNFLNQEYMMLGDLILKPPLPSQFDVNPPNEVPHLVSPSFLSELSENQSRPFISLGDSIDDTKPPEFDFDFSHDDAPRYVSPLVSHHIYQTVQDIYQNQIINFDYPSSYHSLTHFLKTRFLTQSKDLSETQKEQKRSNLLRILKLIASYRPTFISAHKSLFQPFDFKFLEMTFQRCLLDYENLGRLNASPTMIWRRTGEIVSISNDLVNLLGMSISEILLKRTFIMELMYDDDSIVNYFRLFKSVAVGNLHSSIFTRCKLIRNNLLKDGIQRGVSNIGSNGFIEFCSVWTVKRDLFDLPMVIVGQFLPVLPTDGKRLY